MPRLSKEERGGASRTSYVAANKAPEKVREHDGPTPFLALPWDSAWDEEYEAWQGQFNEPAALDSLIANRDGECFDLSLKQRNSRYSATLVNQDVEDGTGPKLLSAFAADPREAILLLYFKWRVKLESIWPAEQSPLARTARG